MPSLVEPLGPDGVPRRPRSTYTAFVESSCGYERELPRGLGPGDAPALPAEGGVAAMMPDSVEQGEDEPGQVEPAQVESENAHDMGDSASGQNGPTGHNSPNDDAGADEYYGQDVHGGPNVHGSPDEHNGQDAPSGHERDRTTLFDGVPDPFRAHTPVSGALRYRVQFTAGQEPVDLLSEARDLL